MIKKMDLIVFGESFFVTAISHLLAKQERGNKVM